jgi:hypothetical protein
MYVMLTMVMTAGRQNTGLKKEESRTLKGSTVFQYLTVLEIGLCGQVNEKREQANCGLLGLHLILKQRQQRRNNNHAHTTPSSHGYFVYV